LQSVSQKIPVSLRTTMVLNIMLIKS